MQNPWTFLASLLTIPSYANSGLGPTLSRYSINVFTRLSMLLPPHTWPESQLGKVPAIAIASAVHPRQARRLCALINLPCTGPVLDLCLQPRAFCFFSDSSVELHILADKAEVVPVRTRLASATTSCINVRDASRSLAHPDERAKVVASVANVNNLSERFPALLRLSFADPLV